MTLPALEGFDSWLEAEMTKWHVPGAAVAVIYKGEVVLSKGYGLRDVAQNLPVTPETLFAIGSCTKAFTAFDIALLVEEGKLSWDTPLREYLPDFRMYDPVATEQITARDITSHRSGLPRHDFLWYGSSFNREDLYRRLQYLKPNKPFRYGYEYQNLMFMLAGYLVGKVAGTSWEALTQERILDRLGMSATNFSVSVSETAANASLPYEFKDEKVQAIPFRNIDNVAPAGSINSNLIDLVKWLSLHLKGDESFLPSAALKQMHAPHTPMPMTPDQLGTENGEIGHTAYALGWASQTYRGHTLIRHGGGIDGFISSVSFLPFDDIGIIILTNLNETPIVPVIHFNLCDRLLGLDQLPWSDRTRELTDKMTAAGEEAKQKLLSQRILGTRPSHPLDAYVGTYQHPGYGTLTIRLEDKTLIAKTDLLDLKFEHHHYDVFILSGKGEVEMFMPASFEIDLKGAVVSISVPFEPNGDPIVFTRV
ncbi:MAG: serine hydrolase [Chloroflexi bacterium]|nr:serine hydrolase [Chloroflexota bacterium]